MTNQNNFNIYPIDKLRSKYYNRIRTTGFMNQTPNAIVSFKLFTNLVAKLYLTEIYADVINKALNNLSFYTEKGFIPLSEVKHMFTDDRNICVAVLKNGDNLTLLTPPGVNLKKEKHPLIGSPLELIVSTNMLKKYFLTHRAEFPNLNFFSDLIDSKIPHRGIQDSKIFNQLVVRCLDEEWVQHNLYKCIDELSSLLDDAQFILTQTKITKKK